MNVRSFVLALPEVEQQQTWGHPTFRVCGKIFASLPDDGTAIVKTTPDEQAALVAEDPETYAVAPRVGRYGWVTVQLSAVPTGDLRALVWQAWQRTAPRRLVAEHSEAPAS